MIAAERGIRMKLVAAARRLSLAGANAGTSGNLSARIDGGYLVTPSAVAYETMHPEDLVFIAELIDKSVRERVLSQKGALVD